MGGLDPLAFPHIFDAIVAYAPYDSLLVLRRVSRALKDTVDARIFDHVCMLLRKDNIVLRSVLGGRRLPLDIRVATWLENGASCVAYGFFTYIPVAHEQYASPPPAVDWDWQPGDFAQPNEDLEAVATASKQDGIVTDPRKSVAGRHLAALHLTQAALARTRRLDVDVGSDPGRVSMVGAILGKRPSGLTNCATSHADRVPRPYIIRGRGIGYDMLGQSPVHPVVVAQQLAPATAVQDAADAVRGGSVSRVVLNLPRSTAVKRLYKSLSWRSEAAVVLENVVIIVHPSDTGYRTDYAPDYVMQGQRAAQMRMFLRGGGRMGPVEAFMSRLFGPRRTQRVAPDIVEVVENHPTDDALFLAAQAARVLNAATTFTIVGAPDAPDSETITARYPILARHSVLFVSHGEYRLSVGDEQYDLETFNDANPNRWSEKMSMV